MAVTVAALYVEPRGIYADLPDVEIWDKERDARLYAGPCPVVAHPPCARWCRLAGLVEARWGHTRGEDDGCFEAALSAVRRFGGVLEHPAYSDAWLAFGLNRPPTGGGWVNADWEGGWTCYVEQRHYGHRAKKASWLYAHSVELPRLCWNVMPDQKSDARVSWCGNHVSSHEQRPLLGKRERSATPEPFRDVLLDLARTTRRRDDQC